MRIIKIYIAIGLLNIVIAGCAEAQSVVQTWVDPCTGTVQVATFPLNNMGVTVVYRNLAKTFTAQQANAGELYAWINQVTASVPCPVLGNPVVTQAVTAAATSAATAAATAAASAAASAAAEAAASAAASAAAEAASKAAAEAAAKAAAAAAAKAATSAAVPVVPVAAAPVVPVAAAPTPTPVAAPAPKPAEPAAAPKPDPKPEAKTETKTEAKAEAKAEEKTETKAEAKAEEKTEAKTESKAEDKKAEDKKAEDKKAEEKKKDDEKKKAQASANPLMVASDLTTGESADGTLTTVVNVGASRSSLMGDKSYGATLMLWSTLDQGALSLSYTKMNFKKGKLNYISAYSSTSAYLKGTIMSMVGYTWVKPHPKFGVMGVSLGEITLFMPEKIDFTIKDSLEIAKWLVDNNIKPDGVPLSINVKKTAYHASFATSAVAFWMHPPISINNKIVISPQIFVMASPISYNSITGLATNKTVGTMVGVGMDYKMSKRFGISSAWRIMMMPGTTALNYLMIGSRLML